VPVRETLVQLHQLDGSSALSNSDISDGSSQLLAYTIADINSFGPFAAILAIAGLYILAAPTDAPAPASSSKPAEVATATSKAPTPASPPKLQGLAAAATPVKENQQTASASPIPSAAGMQTAEAEDELAFSEGQRVLLLGPLAMKGKQGNIVGPLRNQEAFAVRLDSGSIFHILTDNLEAADVKAPAAASVLATPIPPKAIEEVKQPAAKHHTSTATATGKHLTGEADEELEFAEGQTVTLLGPPAMKGKHGVVLNPVQNQEAFAVRLSSGSVFFIRTENLQEA